MGALVIDASAALHITLAARPTRLDGYELIAPDLFLSERLAALVALGYRTNVSRTDILEAFDRLEGLAVRIVASDRDHRRAALDLAVSLGWAKSYDAEYVVMAQRLGCPLLTTDVRLARGAGHLVSMLDPRTLEPT